MNKCAKGFFTASIVLNVFLIGAVGGHYYRMWQDHPWWETREDLAPENQNLVAGTFQGAYREIREVGDEARKVRAEIVKILSAEKFDERAFDRQIKKLAVTRNKIAAIKIEATKELATKLSQEERVKIAERMARMVGGGWERHVGRPPRLKVAEPEDTPSGEE